MQRRALDFRPDVYGGNRLWWASGMADAARTLGDTARMRAYADSGLQVEASGGADMLFLRAQLYAMAGRRAEAERMIARYRQTNRVDIATRDKALGMTYTYLPDPPDSAIKYIRRSIDAGWGRICEPGAIRFAPECVCAKRSPLQAIPRADCVGAIPHCRAVKPGREWKVSRSVQTVTSVGTSIGVAARSRGF